MLEVGRVFRFKVLRQSDLGYVLGNDVDSVLLHNNQACGKKLKPNDVVEAFIQYDSKGRITATLEKPSITLGNPGFADVVSVDKKLGVFISINTFKDILLSKDNLPINEALWPEVGDRLLVKMVSKKTHLNMSFLTPQEIYELNPNLTEFKRGKSIVGTIYKVTTNAINLVTDDLVNIYVPVKQFREKVRIGSKQKVMIIGQNDKEIIGSLNKVKEEMIEVDEKIILEYLEKHNGKAFLTAKSDSELIEKELHMSRKAFKRALGSLYKNRKVVCYDTYTELL